MINEIALIVCDKCNTVSFGEAANCVQCGKMMKLVVFARKEEDPKGLIGLSELRAELQSYKKRLRDIDRSIHGAE